MFQAIKNGSFGRSLLVTAGILSLSIMASAASAGECPADQKKPNAREPVNVEHVGVTDTVIAEIDVENEPANIKDRLFRMRKLTIEPNGTVPWHSHADRPDIIYIIEGEIEEYASNCAGPIVHKAGDVIPETSEVSHWWKNVGDKTVVLLSVDLAKDPNEKNM
jgi:quercetin dioxygenase-like cupin family protein